MRKLVFFIIAMLALFNLITAFATYNTQTYMEDPMKIIQYETES